MQSHPSGFTNVLRLMAAFVAASMVMGLLAAGIAIPFVGATGATAKAAVGTFDALPTELTMPVLAQQTRILANDGSTELATLYTENRTVVPLTAVSKYMRDAQVAIEDDRYYEHGGIDTRGLLRAFVATMRGDTQGASTITQQYVRQALVTNALLNDDQAKADAAMERRGIAGVVRKLQEAKYAIELEKQKSKDQILEGYLNLVFYGANSYGVEAAAIRYFGVHAKDLTLPQAAMIAGIPQAPTTYNPLVPDNAERAISRRNDVLDRMAATGKASPAEVAAAKKSPLGINPQILKPNCESAVDKWVCLYVEHWLVKNVPALGKTESERKARLLRGGLTIKTTLDVNLIKSTRQILTDWIPSEQEKDVGTAAAVVEPGTGKVLAIGQSSQPTNDLVWSVDSDLGQGGGFQIGSTAKMYAVVEALKKGLGAWTTLNATPSGTVYDQSRFRAGECDAMGGPWRVGNFEGTQGGRMSLQAATVYSVNTAFADLATRIGVCDTKALMKDMGLHKADGSAYGDVSPSIILGADNASPLTMAASFATLAAGGRYCEPYPVESITQYDGTKLDLKVGTCRDTTVSPRIAYNTTQILRGVTSPNALAGGRDSAGKTGTSDGGSHLWMIGYTPQRSTAVWTGRTLQGTKPLTGARIGNNWYGNPVGSQVSGPTWRRIMNAAHEGLPNESFRILTRQSADGKVVVPDLRGTYQQEAIAALQEAGLTVRTGQWVNDPNLDGGQVVRTDPAGGTSVDPGTTVTLTLAAARYTPPPPQPSRRATQQPTSTQGPSPSQPQATTRPRAAASATPAPQ
ncbi:MAG: transglycosylase domain-containing protein [Austwickia sp.]|nr:transglycosylase domain-containing protein [Austwickia sp.]